MAHDVTCRIAKSHRAIEHTAESPAGLITTQRCDICGHWKALTDVVLPAIDDARNADLMPYLAAHIRQSNEAGQAIVELAPETWRQSAEIHAHTSIPKKLDMVLRWYERKSRYAGDFVTLVGGDY